MWRHKMQRMEQSLVWEWVALLAGALAGHHLPPGAEKGRPEGLAPAPGDISRGVGREGASAVRAVVADTSHLGGFAGTQDLCHGSPRSSPFPPPHHGLPGLLTSEASFVGETRKLLSKR